MIIPYNYYKCHHIAEKITAEFERQQIDAGDMIYSLSLALCAVLVTEEFSPEKISEFLTKLDTMIKEITVIHNEDEK